ncbi:MAG TPA: hypothetical protein H9962_05760 [Candidatus Mailhella merdigallinarum]|uniref:Uncharacterized protein n=1 Tax=Candidatus Mailhella merdigallinarum TaxID=2838658 RepID=A0A9D2HCG5_9BACT|nr:hypothetical protein [Candidatus Mailhella merdigallinarum]
MVYPFVLYMAAHGRRFSPSATGWFAFGARAENHKLKGGRFHFALPGYMAGIQTYFM